MPFISVYFCSSVFSKLLMSNLLKVNKHENSDHGSEQRPCQPMLVFKQMVPRDLRVSIIRLLSRILISKPRTWPNFLSLLMFTSYHGLLQVYYLLETVITIATRCNNLKRGFSFHINSLHWCSHHPRGRRGEGPCLQPAEEREPRRDTTALGPQLDCSSPSQTVKPAPQLTCSFLS